MSNKWLKTRKEGNDVIVERCSKKAKGKVIIPFGVTCIDDSAFYGCKDVTSIIIPDSVTSIGDDAFDETAWYENQPDGVVYAGKVALCYKGDMPRNTSITLKEGTLGIADWAFHSCVNLNAITIPEGCLRIGGGAFDDCVTLTTINIPESVVSLDTAAFDRTPWLARQHEPVVYVGSVAYFSRTKPGKTDSIHIKEGTKTIYADTSACRAFESVELKSLFIPDSVTSISEYAFEGLNNLESIVVDENNPVFDSRNNCNAVIETATNRLLLGCKNTVIPKGVVRIEQAFNLSKGLTSLYIPDSVTSFDNYAFWGLCDLESIVVDENNPVFDSRNNCNAIYESATNKLVLGCKNTIIQKGTKRIGAHAFDRRQNLKSIVLPEGIQYIDELAFLHCTNLRSVVFPHSLKKIGYGAFEGCTNLRSVVFPESLKEIGSEAFYNCEKLESVSLPEGLKTIDFNAFARTGLRSVSIPKSVERLDDDAFDEKVHITRK